jgi:hypothetical protein
MDPEGNRVELWQPPEISRKEFTIVTFNGTTG